MLRIVQLTISAARADGALSAEERADILGHVRPLGAEALVARELDRTTTLPEIVTGVTDPAERADLYTLAFSIIRADETVSGAERIYLAQLAALLGLDAVTTTELEQRAAGQIDSQP